MNCLLISNQWSKGGKVLGNVNKRNQIDSIMKAENIKIRKNDENWVIYTDGGRKIFGRAGNEANK